MGEQTKNLSLTRWMLFNSLGWIIGVIVSILLAELVEFIKLEFLGFGLGLGMGTALMQWFVGRRYMAIGIRWVWFGIVGIGGSFFFVDVCMLMASMLGYNNNLDGTPAAVVIGLAAAVGSLFTGILQERMLQRLYPSARIRWSQSTLIGWTTTAILVAVYVGLTIHFHVARTLASGLANIVVIMSGGPIIGYFTGKKVRSLMSTAL